MARPYPDQRTMMRHLWEVPPREKGAANDIRARTSRRAPYLLALRQPGASRGRDTRRRADHVSGDHGPHAIVRHSYKNYLFAATIPFTACSYDAETSIPRSDKPS